MRDNAPARRGRRLGSLCGLLIGLASCSDQPAETPGQFPQAAALPRQEERIVTAPEQARGRIRTVIVQERLAPRTITAPGEVEADLSRVAKVSSRIDGVVDKVFAQLGERVEAGRAMASIGSLKLDELIQEFLVSKARADLAKSTYERTTRLLAEKIVSQRQFQEAKAAYLEARSVHQHVREKLLNMGLSNAELNELVRGSHIEGHRYTLRAPLGGTIVSQNVVIGQGVLPGEELFRIVDASTVWVFANLPIEQARRFKVGDLGVIVPKGRAPIEARLAYIAPVADRATLTLRLRFDLDNRGGVLKPNEYVEVKLMEEAAPVLAVPTSAVTMIEGVRGVFVNRDEGYAFVPIEVGQQGDGWVEVRTGVGLGEAVAVAGVFDLKNAFLQASIQGD